MGEAGPLSVRRSPLVAYLPPHQKGAPPKRAGRLKSCVLIDSMRGVDGSIMCGGCPVIGSSPTPKLKRPAHRSRAEPPSREGRGAVCTAWHRSKRVDGRSNAASSIELRLVNAQKWSTSIQRWFKTSRSGTCPTGTRAGFECVQNRSTALGVCRWVRGHVFGESMHSIERAQNRDKELMIEMSSLYCPSARFIHLHLSVWTTILR